jgi:TetR/AcrR family transcriptional regulator, ethionamide resistance regulator
MILPEREPSAGTTPGWVQGELRERAFCDLLSARAAGVGLRKGERTRLRLLAATAAILQEEFVHTLRIGDICAAAGVSPGTFYLYFDDKVAITTAMLKGFAQHVFDCLDAAARGANDFEASVQATTLAYVRAFELNRGLFRALMQMTEESASIERVYQRLNRRWNQRTARAIARYRGVMEGPEEDDILRAFALGGMVDEFLANLYVRRDPVLTERLSSPESVARLLAGLWLQELPRSDRR